MFPIHTNGVSLFNACVPLQEDFKNSSVLNDSIKVGPLTCQTFKNSLFHFLFFVESVASKFRITLDSTMRRKNFISFKD
jgi:hypothetical protein